MLAGQSTFPGARVTPEDPRYPTLVRGFNQRWIGHPRHVQVVGDAQHVLAAVDSYGCQINAVDPAATAVPQRSSILKLQYQTYWTEPAQDPTNLGWIDGFYGEMYGPRGPWPDDVFDGCYVNYPDSDLRNWQHLYYKESYPRLQRVKRQWDPHDVFHHDQSIELP